MSGVIDTNILLYAANENAAEFAAARRFLEGACGASERYYLAEGICYEFLRVSTHPKVFPRPLTAVQALNFVETLFQAESIDWLVAGDGHLICLRHVLERLHHPAGNLFFDLRTAALMRESGVRRIYTADTDFLQMADLEVVNPLV
ncbi:MAG: TA system VapC family ribonuclease toxin [Opitutales bacterium]